MPNLVDSIYGFPLEPSLRLKIVMLVDVTDSIPNGDPYNAGNPRVDFDGYGRIEKASLFRMIRNYVEQNCNQALYMSVGADLNKVQDRYKIDDKNFDTDKMLRDLWDLPMFGAPLTASGAKIRGAFQMSNGRSIDPIQLVEIGFTSSTVKEDTRTKNGKTETYNRSAFNSYEMVQYGLYRFEATYNPADGAKHGITPAALQALWAGLIEGWEFNRSAHRTKVNLRRVYAFQYDNQRGLEPSHVTQARVQAVLREGVIEPRRFEDYEVSVNDDLPNGVRLYRWEDGVVEAGTELAAK